MDLLFLILLLVIALALVGGATLAADLLYIVALVALVVLLVRLFAGRRI